MRSWKKWTAALLATAMILSSGSLTQAVYAEEPDEVNDVEISTVLEGDVSEPSDTGIVIETEPAVSEGEGTSTSAEDEVTEPEADQEQEEEQEQPKGEEQDPEIVEEAEDASEEVPDAEAADAVEEVSYDAEDALLANADEPYDIDVDGVLILKDGVSVTSRTAILPAETVTIPKGIFDSGSKASSVTRIDFSKCTDTLTTIASGAFSGSKITAVNALPTGVTVIEDYAFQNCYDLKTFTFTNNEQIESVGKEAFMNSGLTAIDIPAAVEIGESAFADCSSLTSVTLRDCESIGNYAFKNCQSLAGSMDFGTNLKEIGMQAFYNCGFKSIELDGEIGGIARYEDGAPVVVTMGDYAFAKNAKLESVTLPRTLKAISPYAFSGCTKLTTVNMYKKDSDVNITDTVGASAFSGCSALKTIELGSSVKKVDTGAFSGCSLLVNIDFYYAGYDEEPIDIAESAFPERSNKTGTRMRSYDPSVESYADRRGYIYEPLGAHKLTAAKVTGGTLKLSNTTAAKGTTVKITAVPSNGYSLKWNSVTVNGATLAVSLDSYTQANQIYTFTMPDQDTEVSADFVKTSEAVGGNIYYDVKGVEGEEGEEGISFDNSKSMISFGVTGTCARLLAVSDSEGKLGLWCFALKSSDTKVFTVDPMGLITAVGPGKATLTVTPTGAASKARKFTVNVGKYVVIDEMDFEPWLNPDKKEEPFKSTNIKSATIYPKGYEDGYGLGDTRYNIIDYNATTVAANQQTFTAQLNAVDDSGIYKVVSAKWTTSDAGVAKLSATTTTDNSVTVTVPKNATGVSIITATVKNDDPDIPEVKAGFIVRVRDRSPRLYGNVVVNKRNPNGAKLQITTVYGTKIDSGEGISIDTKSVDKNGQVSYTASELFDNCIFDEKDDDEGDYYIVAAVDSKRQKIANKLYMSGHLDDGSEFHVLMPSVEITDNDIKPKLTTKGSINLFYNNEADQRVSFTHNIAGAKIDYDLTEIRSVKNYPNYTEYDKFQANFEIVEPDPDDPESSDDTTIVLRLNSSIDDDNSYLEKEGSAVVTKGYVRLVFEGYSVNEAFWIPITVPTTNKAPAYNPDTKSFAVYPGNIAPTFSFRLLDSKKKPLELIEHDDDVRKSDGTPDYDRESGESWSGNSLIKSVEYNEKTTMFFFDENASFDADKYKYEDRLSITLDEGRLGRQLSAGKAVVDLRLTTWTKPIAYTISFTKAAVPKGTFAAQTLNTGLPFIPATAALSLNQDQMQVVEYRDDLNTTTDLVKVNKYNMVIEGDDCDFLFTGNAALLDKARQIVSLAEVDDNGAIVFTLPEDEDDLAAIAKIPGTYSFQVAPVVNYEDNDYGDSFCLGLINLKVTVVANKPLTLKIASTKFTLNSQYQGTQQDSYISKTSVTNLPAGYTYKIAEDQTGVRFYDAKDKKLENPLPNPFGKFSGASITVPSKSDANRTLQTGLKGELNGAPKATANYSYLVSNIGIDIYKADAEGTPVKDEDGDEEDPVGHLDTTGGISVTFAAQAKQPDINIKATGSLNQIDTDSAITYTFTTKNINYGTISELAISELVGRKYTEPGETTPHFFIEQAVDKDGDPIVNTYKLTLNPDGILDEDNPLKYGQSYSLRFAFKLKETQDQLFVKEGITVKPVQTFASLTLIDTKAYKYVGAKDQTIKVFVKQNNIPGALVRQDKLNEDKTGVVAGVRISTKAAANIKEAFSIKEVSDQFVTAGQWLYDDEKKEYRVATVDDAAEGTYRSIMVDQTTSKPVKDAKGLPTYGFYVTLSLDHPSVLAGNKTYTVPIEIRYLYQNVDTNGTMLNLSTTVYK